ncbi:hypothetical protein RFI_27354, partial [Reticulomyxa filosa]
KKKKNRESINKSSKTLQHFYLLLQCIELLVSYGHWLFPFYQLEYNDEKAAKLSELMLFSCPKCINRGNDTLSLLSFSPSPSPSPSASPSLSPSSSSSSSLSPSALSLSLADTSDPNHNQINHKEFFDVIHPLFFTMVKDSRVCEDICIVSELTQFGVNTQERYLLVKCLWRSHNHKISETCQHMLHCNQALSASLECFDEHIIDIVAEYCIGQKIRQKNAVFVC